MISIIIPTRNRSNNLDCVLTSLANQSTDRDWEAIVVDDRSTDNTRDIVKKHPFAKYVKVTGKHKTWNASIPRNLGAKAASGEIFWFLDSDVVLPNTAIDITIHQFLKGNRARVLIGAYHWLPPQVVTPDDVINKWHQLISGELPEMKIVHRGMAGMRDIRERSFETAPNSQAEYDTFTDALACFGGYLVLTKQTFWAAGGYDESMLAGVEDGDFGITLFEMGAKFSYLQEVCGYHIAHEQPKGRMPKDVADQVHKLDEKHKTDIILQSGKAYRKWGIDWTPPPEFYDHDEEKLEKYKRLWKEDKDNFMLKINKK